jgi:hypothetical protein
VDLVRQDGTPTLGLVPVRGQDNGKQPLRVDEQAAVLDAANFQSIDFIFFRRFADGRSSQVAAYVVDNSDQRLNEAALAALHGQLWLHGAAPLLYIAWPSKVDVLTCARGPDFWRAGECKYTPVETLLTGSAQTAAQISAELEKSRRFSALRLTDGTFWEDPGNGHLADYSKAAHQSLIQAVVEADRDLQGSQQPLMRRLLLLMVLIKYLEDRKVFPAKWFTKFHSGAASFFEVLQGGDADEVRRLLDAFEHKFNGDIFLLEQGYRLTKTALRRFAELVEGRTLTRQRYLWQQYSFEHLPVEIISNLYQRFVHGGHGTVYTPPFLVSLLLDHAMPYDKLTGNERVLDPACGSGVFLVAAFRRLIHVWRSQHAWQRPTVDTLKKILRESIFGIEWDGNAVDLTAFSLALAVCDALKPEVIWNDLTFDRLRRTNLFEGDFFAALQAKPNPPIALGDGFDCVIGNPPFESQLTPAGQSLDRVEKMADKNRGPIPDKQAAYLFLEQGLRRLRREGRACLIQPSAFLYNRKVGKFRKNIFRKHRVEVIMDFTSIRKLYEADPKTIAVLAEAGQPDSDHFIDHWTYRRTVSVQERMWFELDHYDRHRVLQSDAESDPFIWRVNLLGGGRLLDVSKRLRALTTLQMYVKSKGWDYGEGFIAAKTGRRTPAPFLTGKSLLPTDAFTENGIDEGQIGTVTETHFRSAYTEDRFRAPLVLIRGNEMLPMAFWDKGFLAYRDKIVGIHSPQSQITDLRAFYDTLKQRHERYRFCCTLNGSQALVGKATAILKQDIDVLPFPENPRALTFSFWEQALQDDILKYMTAYTRLGQNSPLLQEQATANHLKAYAEMYCRLLGSIYDNMQAHEPIYLNGLTCQPFYFGERPNLPWLGEATGEHLAELVYHEHSDRLRTVRVVFFYLKNVILLVKPDRLRYWIPSTAIRDADETLVDLHQNGF